ncbi:hypothetical protein [Streptomyces mirabilis]|uniref:hypothetical protein n=1 Tax=Streptomyces mirabilis TaxID=68239 RepID=UPI0036645467
MEPFQAQGAAQAIRDAAVLGDALADATSPEVPDTLNRYAHRGSRPPRACRPAPRGRARTITRTSRAKPRVPGSGRSDVEELDAALQELARRSSSLRLPREWKTA